MIRVTLTGVGLARLEITEPAASVRILLPSPGAGELVIPKWNGNQFLLPSGQRPVIRTFTPRRLDADEGELDIDVVAHEGGIAPAWASEAQPGDEAAVSGPARGYAIDSRASRYLLLGDETAIPAISQLIESMPITLPTDVHIETEDPRAQLELPPHPKATVNWHDRIGNAPPGETLVEFVGNAALDDGARVWAAGEAASMQRIRRHLFSERGLPRSSATVRGYWKFGRSG